MIEYLALGGKIINCTVIIIGGLLLFSGFIEAIFKAIGMKFLFWYRIVEYFFYRKKFMEWLSSMNGDGEK